MMQWLLIGLVKGYRLLLSPWLGSACRFEPTCSAYAIEALERHGAGCGSYLTLRRLGRCQPWCEGGHDPVPLAPRPAAGLFSFCRFGPPPAAEGLSAETGAPRGSSPFPFPDEKSSS